MSRVICDRNSACKRIVVPVLHGFRLLDGVETQEWDQGVVAAAVPAAILGSRLWIGQIGFTIVVLMPVLVSYVRNRQYRFGPETLLDAKAVLVGHWQLVLVPVEAGNVGDRDRRGQRIDRLTLWCSGFANRTPLLKGSDGLNGIFGPALYMSLP